MPLVSVLAFYLPVQYPRERCLPQDYSSVNEKWKQLGHVAGILLPQIPNLADNTATSSTLHTLNYRSGPTVLDNQIDTDTIGELHNFLLPVGIFGIVDCQDWRVRVALLHHLELLITRRGQDHSEPCGSSKFKCERSNSASALETGQSTCNQSYRTGPTLNQHSLSNPNILQRRPRSHTRARNNTRNSPIQILREPAQLLLIKHDIIRQHPILIRRQPRPSRLSPRNILRISDRRCPVSKNKPLHLVAHGNDLASGIVTDDSIRCDRPGIPAVRDVGVAIVERYSMDLDQDRCRIQWKRESLGDEFKLSCSGGIVVCPPPASALRDLVVCHFGLVFSFFWRFWLSAHSVWNTFIASILLCVNSKT